MTTSKDLEKMERDFMDIRTYDELLSKYPYSMMKDIEHEIKRSSPSDELKYRLRSAMDVYKIRRDVLYERKYPPSDRKTYVGRVTRMIGRNPFLHEKQYVQLVNGYKKPV